MLDADGRRIAEAATVVLANAADALRLIGATRWPVQTVRGQISLLPVASAPAWQPPRLPVAGAGYLLPEVDGLVTFGASAQPGDLDLRRAKPTMRSTAAAGQAVACAACAARCVDAARPRRLALRGRRPAAVDRRRAR
ncbi:MAG: hypothetical protein U1E95_07715 [Rubrivivax sp.]